MIKSELLSPMMMGQSTKAADVLEFSTILYRNLISSIKFKSLPNEFRCQTKVYYSVLFHSIDRDIHFSTIHLRSRTGAHQNSRHHDVHCRQHARDAVLYAPRSSDAGWEPAPFGQARCFLRRWYFRRDVFRSTALGRKREPVCAIRSARTGHGEETTNSRIPWTRYWNDLGSMFRWKSWQETVRASIAGPVQRPEITRLN